MVAFRTLSTSACSRLPIRLLAFSPQQPVQLIVKPAQQATSRARRTHLNRPATDFSPLLPPEPLNHVIKNSLRCPPGANMTNLQEMTFVSVLYLHEQEPDSPPPPYRPPLPERPANVQQTAFVPGIDNHTRVSQVPARLVAVAFL